MSMPGAAHVEAADGGCMLSGSLDFDSVEALWRALQSGGWLGTAEKADLARVTDCDSAGLALLVAWRAARARAGGTLRFEAAPERLRALARLTQAESLFDT